VIVALGLQKVALLLFRDTDNMILTYRVNIGADRNVHLGQPIFWGYAVQVDRSFALPSDEVPLREVSWTCATGRPSYSAIVMLALAKGELAIPHYNIYIFKKSDSGFIRIGDVKPAGTGLTEFILRDLNGDCAPEMIDISKATGLTVVNVRTIEERGKITLLQQISGRVVLLDQSDPYHLKMTVVTSEGWIQGQKRSYEWNGSSRAFSRVERH